MSATTEGEAKLVAKSPPAAPFALYMDQVPSGFAVTRGAGHTFVYTNAAFRRLVGGEGETMVGRAAADVFTRWGMPGVVAMLDRTRQSGVVRRDLRLESSDASAPALTGTVWPDAGTSDGAAQLLIELHLTTHGELALGLQRDVSERLLLSALRETDAAELSESSRIAAKFLAAESSRLDESLDEGATLVAMASMSLPHFGAWCIVDTLDDDGTMHRVAMIHSDPAKQKLLDDLHGTWVPAIGDGFGLPAAVRSLGPTAIAEDVEAALATAAHDPQIFRALQELAVTSLLTVPLVVRKKLLGAVTYVGGQHDRPFTPDDLALATDLAGRSAMALDRSRLYGNALALKALAETASEAKSTFLGMVSHELRTPLNAIGGYVDLLDLEIHGPITEAQRGHLSRIRISQRYLAGLITDLLNLTKVGSGQTTFDIRDVSACDVLAASVSLVEATVTERGLIFDGVKCSPDIAICADRDRAIQIMVNLLSNAIKFTAVGGRITVGCVVEHGAVHMCVSDTGIGIPADKLEIIFGPFMQLKSDSLGSAAGIGLGLAISRGLAEGMGGSLAVESTEGEGARFTLILPRSEVAPGAITAGR